MADRSEAAVVRDQVRLQNEPLSIDVAHTLVAHPAAGAIATFTGTTRDNFDGKRVVTLEYEAYGPMALSEMRKLCAKGRAEYPSVMRVALFHRLGPVAIGESSVITAVSSPHRADALGKAIGDDSVANTEAGANNVCDMCSVLSISDQRAESDCTDMEEGGL